MLALGTLGNDAQDKTLSFFGAKNRGGVFFPTTFAVLGILHLIETDSAKREQRTRRLIKAGDHFARLDCQELAQGLRTIAKSANAYAAHINTVQYCMAGTLALSGFASLIDTKWPSSVFLAGILASIGFIFYDACANREGSRLDRIREAVDVCLQQLETQQKQTVLPTAIKLSSKTS